MLLIHVVNNKILKPQNENNELVLKDSQEIRSAECNNPDVTNILQFVIQP